MTIWDDWKREQEAKKLVESMDAVPPPATPKVPVSKRPMTESEIQKVASLSKITFGFGNRYAKRFTESLKESPEITERQGWYIDVLWYKYRRQLGHNDPKPDGYMTKG